MPKPASSKPASARKPVRLARPLRAIVRRVGQCGRDTLASLDDDDDLAGLPPDIRRTIDWYIADLASTIQRELLFVADHGRVAAADEVLSGRLDEGNDRELLNAQLAVESHEPDLRIVRI